jgi:hypothetical protein
MSRAVCHDIQQCCAATMRSARPSFPESPRRARCCRCSPATPSRACRISNPRRGDTRPRSAGPSHSWAACRARRSARARHAKPQDGRRRPFPGARLRDQIRLPPSRNHGTPDSATLRRPERPANSQAKVTVLAREPSSRKARKVLRENSAAKGRTYGFLIEAMKPSPGTLLVGPPLTFWRARLVYPVPQR